jgi:hypothetical protein
MSKHEFLLLHNFLFVYNDPKVKFVYSSINTEQYNKYEADPMKTLKVQ